MFFTIFTFSTVRYVSQCVEESAIRGTAIFPARGEAEGWVRLLSRVWHFLPQTGKPIAQWKTSKNCEDTVFRDVFGHEYLRREISHSSNVLK